MPYVFYALVVALLYFFLNVYLNKFFVIIESTGFLGFISNSFYALFFFSTVLVSLLIGANVSYVIHNYRNVRTVSSKGSVGLVGAFSGILGGLCPGCIVGVFPAIMAFFGIGFSLASLPLYGLELQLLSIVLLVASLILFSRGTTCKIKK